MSSTRSMPAAEAVDLAPFAGLPPGATVEPHEAESPPPLAPEAAALQACRQRVRSFLQFLSARLAYFPPDLRVSYHVSGFGELADLRPQDPRLELPAASEAGPMTLAYDCRGAGAPLTRRMEGSRLAVEHALEYLQSHALSFTAEPLEAMRRGTLLRTDAADALFRIQPMVPVRIVFDWDEAPGRVRITVQNLGHLGRDRYSLQPAQVDELLLTEVDRAVMRKPNRLAAMAGFEVPQAVRDRLRQRLERDARRKALELGDARQGLRRLLSSLVARRQRAK